jgi:transposase
MERRRKFTREFKLEAVRLIKERGVSYAQASQDLGVHVSQLRNWVKAFADDPQHAFPGHGQMKPEQEEIARLKREVTKLKAERDILKNCGRNTPCYPRTSEGSGRQLIGGTVPVKKRGPWVHANLRVVTPFWRRSRLGK